MKNTQASGRRGRQEESGPGERPRPSFTTSHTFHKLSSLGLQTGRGARAAEKHVGLGLSSFASRSPLHSGSMLRLWDHTVLLALQSCIERRRETKSQLCTLSSWWNALHAVGAPTSETEESGLANVWGPLLQEWKVVGELMDLGGGKERGNSPPWNVLYRV